ncbi:MAG: AbrB/MazE/SpoVT family DNA-binding domain-containing protein [Vulcanimicrobiaceae bacterium]
MKSRVGERGQVTIPKALRESLAIRPGTQLEFTEEAGALVARRLEARDPLDALAGLLPRADVGATLAALRGPVWSPELDGTGPGHRGR